MTRRPRTRVRILIYRTRAIVSGIVTRDAPVSYWPIFFFFTFSWKQSQTSLQKLNRPSFLLVYKATSTVMATKVKFSLLQTLSRLFHLEQFTKSWRICLELNSKGLYQFRKRKECHCLVFPSSKKREIFVLSRRGNDGKEMYQKSAMLLQSCCFAYPNLFIFPFSLPLPSSLLELPKVLD